MKGHKHMQKRNSKQADAVRREMLNTLKHNTRRKKTKAKKVRKGVGGERRILRRTYQLKTWRGWDHQIHLSAVDFFNAFGVYPNILLANSVTFARMDIAANKENITGPEGRSIGEHQVVRIGGFSSEDYGLEFCIQEKMNDKSFSLIFDSDPDGDGGEEVPEEDTETEDVNVNRSSTGMGRRG